MLVNLVLILLLISLADLAISVYIVSTTRQVARALADVTEQTRAELVQHMVANREVAEHAAASATAAFAEANHVNAKIAQIAQGQATAARAEDEARAEQLQSIADTGEDTNRDVKDVKSAVVKAEGSAQAAASSAAASAAANRARSA